MTQANKSPREANPDDQRAEFAAYRQEISDRSGHQHTLLTLNLTVLSVIGGFVLSDKANPLVMLLLPIVSGAIGLLWYDHARNIDSLGDHIRRSLSQFSGYEKDIAAREKQEWRRLPMTCALLILFVIAPVSGLVIPFPGVHGAYWLLWGGGAVVSGMCVYSFAAWVREGFRG
jgi:hypothetical protein